MNLKRFFVLMTLMVAVSSAKAQELGHEDKDFGCIDQPTAEKYVRDFRIDTSSFGGLELCENKVDTKKLFNDLKIIELGQFDSNVTNLLIKGIIPADQYYSWMKSQTRGVDRGNDIPYATAYNRGGYFTMQDGWASSSTLGRVGVVIHEARHTAGYRHYPCNQGSYNGANLDGCDQSYAQSGSHAVEMEYYARVSVAGKNFHPVYKAMARLMAMGRANFVFNQMPMKQREGILAIGENGPVLFDSGKKMTREGNDFTGRLKRTSFGASLFNGLQAMALELYELTGAHSGNDDDYSYFKLLKMSQLGELRDFEEFDTNQKRYVTAITKSNQLATYNFPRGAWNGLVNLSGDIERTATTLASGERGYFLVGKNGKIQSFNPENQQISETGKTWNFDNLSVTSVTERVVILKQSGAIVELLQDGSEKLMDAGPFSQMVSVPLYDAFEVK